MSATAPTHPIPPQPFQPSADASAPSAPPADHVPWYRRVWVLVVGAVLIAVLAFGSGFIAGNAASLFDGLLGVPTRGMIDDGPGFRDGVPPSDGEFPQMPGDTTSQSG
ncbi:hypothetical protein [Agromyces sp. Soil535]|uniref:hypothetical protein n=1 Tax=Agromyces sp. Soil535 TaxID=1736390 RepID=UPI0006F8C73E|nr:hypothetical protein [Agromyces sp. Soil535]KRE23102.1 hypothetical protein ASG80_09665 [Agromyces sp. Soil535]